MKKVKKEGMDFLKRYLVCIVGIFIVATSYNLFYVPNNFVTGGVTGLSIVLSKITNIDASVYVIIGNIFFIILCLASLGLKKSIVNLIGAITFSGFVILTKNISNVIDVNFSNQIYTIICAGVLTGFGSGLVYKVNFTTGGTDILVDIIKSKWKQPVGEINLLISIIVMSFGTFVFGVEMLVSALIIKFIESTIIDKILIGISDSKMLLIHTSKENDIKAYLLNEIESGVTVLSAQGGYSKKNKNLIMCIVSTERYYKVKEQIKEIDPTSFIIVSDCYEVYGGTKRKRRVNLNI